MYTNAHTKADSDLEGAFKLIEYYPFGTLISINNGQPVISHLPLTPIQIGSFEKPTDLQLIGHLARANPHSKILANGPVTVAFMGGHAYITPKWYAENDVPTWNYSAIHVTARVELIEEYDGLIDCLKTLSAHAEKQWPSGWEFFLPDDLSPRRVLEKSIVGFRLHVETLNFKKKLGLNRSLADQLGVAEGLKSRPDSESHAVRQAWLEATKNK